LVAALIALAASLSWGLGDFLGGLKARTLPVLAVMACSQPFGLAALAIGVTARGHGFPGGDVFWAIPAALLGTIGLAAFYRGLAEGAMAVAAPIAGAGAVIPVAFGLATGDRPGFLRSVGMVLAIGGVVVTSREPGAKRAKLAAGAAWGLLALLCFGGYYIPMRQASQSDFLWASLLFRTTSVPLVWGTLLALGRRLPGGLGPQLPLLALVGFCDTGGNVLFAAATTQGLISVVSVLASLYPVVTVLLARVALHERTALSQQAGVVVTLAGVALISTG
jgi:drug/metabolite transporter (DMT)-like permease